ncbi:MAG: hypothetical protein OEY19_07205 [Gammaproteobacteria bacterium]|nr:hypothetical protein [Gammaproteobacteria bacterium]MDH5630740.1 hypothetical protein [Gammaproteobacteria bacterium]
MLENLNMILIIAVVAGLLSLFYLISTLKRIKKLRLIGAVSRLAGFLLFLSISLTLSLIMVGTSGYHALTKEELVAEIEVKPIGQQQFQVNFVQVNQQPHHFILDGDELLIDAYILKWKSWTNILGLHTAYRLERISGRYKTLSDERNKQRSVYAISDESGTGIAQWREDHQMLSVLLDVEHGSASFVDADRVARYHLMVTTDGLLLRPLSQ